MRATLSTPLLVAALLLSAAGCASSPAPPSKPSGQTSGAGAQGSVAQDAAQPTASKTPATAGPASGTSDAPSAVTAATETGAAEGAGGPGQTSQERIAALDKRFGDSLGAFDAELHKQQQQVAQEHDTRQTAAAGSTTTDAQHGGKGGGAGTAATEAPQGDADKAGSHGRRGRQHDPAGDLKSEKATTVDDNAGNGATAREIPDGSDDDVVARRLRKAAEQETDPELKEKLWQEYLNYKKNAQTK